MDKCHITIEDADGVEILNISGTLCDDTIFYIDNEYKEIIKNTKGLAGGRVLLYNGNGLILEQLPIIGLHEQNLSTLQAPCILCYSDGQLVGKHDYFVFHKDEVD
jgi:nitrogen fixation protein